LGILKKESFFRKILFLAMICALFVPLKTGYEVQAHSLFQSAITVTARAGLRGFCKPDKWLPVHVTVENTGADVNARVQASYKNSAGGQTISGMDVSLPATSRKEFFLYIMPEGLMRGFTVSVLDGNKALVNTNLNISCASAPTMLFGILADTPSNYGVLNNVQAMTDATQTTQLEITDLPDLAQGWEMLDALIISNVDTGTLSVEQKQALELWLAGGGKLFVTGGVQWQSTAAGLGDLLPIQPTSTKKAALTALSAYVMDSDNPLESETTVATGKMQTGANILVEQNGVPLLMEKEIGFGKVYYFAADPGLQPLNDWNGMQKIYEHLLAFKSPKPSWAYGTWDSYNASTALSTLPELTLPSFIYICCWLGLYIVIIGPVNYFVLRRMKRTELSWVTVPVLVIIFTSLAYFSGYAYRGTKPILNRMMFMQGWQGVEKAKTIALVGVYSPTRTTYNVESQEQLLIAPFPSINENLQGGSDWASVKTNNGAILPEVRVEIGGMQSLSAEGHLPSLSVQHDLTYTLSDKMPTLKGSITNTSGYTLTDAVLVTPNEWEPLGDIAPNGIKKINLSLDNNFSPSQYSLSALFGWDSYQQSEDIVKQRHRSFFQSITTPNSGAIDGGVSTNTGVYLMGWVDGGVSIPVTLQGEELNATDTLFFVEKLTPKLDIKRGKLMLTSSIYEWESSLGDTLTTSSYNLSSSGYNINFRPSLPIHFTEIDSLKLIIGSNNTPQEIHASLWDFQTKTWQPILLDSYGGVNISQAWQYVGMDGELLLNIQGNPNSYFDVTSINFTMMVQP
jgi:hypothetical protein